jgi:hypothetical protein
MMMINWAIWQMTNADTMPICAVRSALLTPAQPLAPSLAAQTGAGGQTLPSQTPRRPAVQMPQPLQPCFFPPAWTYMPPVVGGVFIGGAPVTTAQPTVPSRRKTGERGGDTKKRAPNTCRQCKSKGSADVHKCPGSNSHGKCLHYSCAVCKQQKSCKCTPVQCVPVDAAASHGNGSAPRAGGDTQLGSLGVLAAVAATLQQDNVQVSPKKRRSV